jgi:hypothetical protein
LTRAQLYSVGGSVLLFLYGQYFFFLKSEPCVPPPLSVWIES